MAASTTKLYCACKSEYQPNQFMIECDKCKDWFHGRCVGVSENQAADIDVYHCPLCEQVHGTSTLKRRRSTQRRNYKELNNGIKPIFAGTIDFMKLLKTRKFDGPSNNIVVLGSGSLLSSRYLEANGFREPILVKHAEGLGLKLPPSNFTVYDVEQHVGSLQEIHVIDVARQEDMKMKMKEWTEYYNSPIRTKVLNVISLEFSKTRLSSLVLPPVVVQEISWVENIWPKDMTEDSPHSMPYVQKYCLMGVKDCYTDFHVDFGGTSVWYHVFRGEKVFYLIEPTDENIAKYENWVSSSNQSQVFFGDRVSKCVRCSVKQGETLFIPTGWIHAVMTPTDTLVFGGNFLHSANIGLQLKIYDLEHHLHTPIKFLFPNYETTCWYAARAMLRKLKDIHKERIKIPNFLYKGIETLLRYLRSWTLNKEEFLKFHKFQVPEEVNCTKLLKALEKELKIDMDMSSSNSGILCETPVIVMAHITQMKKELPEVAKKSGSTTVIKLKLTGPNPNNSWSENAHSIKSKKKGLSKNSDRKDAEVLKNAASKRIRKKKIKRRRDVSSETFTNKREMSKKISSSQPIQVQVTNGKISSSISPSSEVNESNISKGHQFQPLVSADFLVQPRGENSEIRAPAIEDQDWEAAQLLSNFHGMDTERDTKFMLPFSDESTEKLFHSVPCLGVDKSSKLPGERFLEQFDATKKDLFHGNRGHTIGQMKTPDMADDYVIREPLAKPQGKIKRSRSDSDSDYDPEEEYYQDANFVYPRLSTTSDLDFDDFSWNPGQRGKRKAKNSLSSKSKLNSGTSHRHQTASFDCSKPGPDDNSRAKSLKDAGPSGKHSLGGDKKREKIRKGSTTAKQRLGKLLKLDKLGGRYLR